MFIKIAAEFQYTRKKTNMFFFQNKDEQKENRNENFLECNQLQVRKCNQQQIWIKKQQTTGYSKEHAFRKNMDRKV